MSVSLESESPLLFEGGAGGGWTAIDANNNC